jgi:hypothetical protein
MARMQMVFVSAIAISARCVFLPNVMDSHDVPPSESFEHKDHEKGNDSE